MAKEKIKGKKDIFKSGFINNATYDDYLYRLKLVATSIFEWVNLPDSMDGNYIEECLYYYGQAALLKDDNLGGFINTRASAGGQLSIYGIPLYLHCFSYTYQTTRRTYQGNIPNDKDKKSAILIRNNYDRLPTISTLELFAYRLYNAERSSDVNIQLQKFPLILLTSDSQKLTMKNFLMQYEGNIPFIMADKDILNLENIKTLNTNVPYIADKIQIYKEKIWNEALNYLGINSLAIEKRERLVQEEATSNNELINYNLQSFLKWRQKACDEFNKYFELSESEKISVRIRSDLKNIIKQAMSVTNDFANSKIDDTIEEEIKGDING